MNFSFCKKDSLWPGYDGKTAFHVVTRSQGQTNKTDYTKTGHFANFHTSYYIRHGYTAALEYAKYQRVFARIIGGVFLAQLLQKLSDSLIISDPVRKWKRHKMTLSFCKNTHYDPVTMIKQVCFQTIMEGSIFFVKWPGHNGKQTAALEYAKYQRGLPA